MYSERLGTLNRRLLPEGQASLPVVDPRPAGRPALPIRQRRGYVTELSKQNIKLVRWWAELLFSHFAGIVGHPIEII
jgi:hypothetical protein